MDNITTSDPALECDSSEFTIATWVLTVMTVLSIGWGGVNEYLSYRRGNRNAQATCVGDCFRIVFNGKIERDDNNERIVSDECKDTLECPAETKQPEDSFIFQVPTSWKVGTVSSSS